MTSNVPDRLGNSLQEIRAMQQQVQQQVQQFSRDAEARHIMDTMSAYDRRLLDRAGEQYQRELRELNLAIERSNLTMAHLLAGVRRAYSTPELPWNAIGAVMTEAKAARRTAGQGRVVREMAALPSAPPSRGPVRAAYGGSALVECPGCGAPAGDPCINPLTGQGKRIPCLVRRGVASTPGTSR